MNSRRFTGFPARPSIAEYSRSRPCIAAKTTAPAGALSFAWSCRWRAGSGGAGREAGCARRRADRKPAGALFVLAGYLGDLPKITLQLKAPGTGCSRHWCVESPDAAPHVGGMKHSARFDLKMPPETRRELAALAAEAGLSSADIVRLSVKWMLQHPGVLLGGDRSAGDRAAA